MNRFFIGTLPRQVDSPGGGHFCCFGLLPVLSGWQLTIDRMLPFLVGIFNPFLCDLTDPLDV
jgi:hypothetical protein